eukprot:1306298-Prymnesium_polylepis.1
MGDACASYPSRCTVTVKALPPTASSARTMYGPPPMPMPCELSVSTSAIRLALQCRRRSLVRWACCSSDQHFCSSRRRSSHTAASGCMRIVTDRSRGSSTSTST